MYVRFEAPACTVLGVGSLYCVSTSGGIPVTSSDYRYPTASRVTVLTTTTCVYSAVRDTGKKLTVIRLQAMPATLVRWYLKYMLMIGTVHNAT